MSPLMPGKSNGKSHLVGKDKKKCWKRMQRDTDLGGPVVHLDGATLSALLRLRQVATAISAF
jgi:hypothetical protein